MVSSANFSRASGSAYSGNSSIVSFYARKGLLVLQNFSTARKSGNISSHTEKLFSSDTRQSMKRRIATERLSKIYIAKCGYTWLNESRWP